MFSARLDDCSALVPSLLQLFPFGLPTLLEVLLMVALRPIRSHSSEATGLLRVHGLLSKELQRPPLYGEVNRVSCSLRRRCDCGPLSRQVWSCPDARVAHFRSGSSTSFLL